MASPSYGGYDPRSCGLSPLELFERTPKEEILAYSAKLEESEGFDVSDFPNAFVYGNVRPLPNLRGDELELVTQLAKSALASYNEQNQDNSYKFEKVVMANAAAVNGMYYYITFLVAKQPTSCCDSDAADDASPPHETFQARVFYKFIGHEVVVEFCRPKPTHPSLREPQQYFKEDPRLSETDSRLYYQMYSESEGLDVPDIPNSSEVPHLFRPMKSIDSDDAKKLRKLCNLCVDKYNRRKQVNCKFVKFLKANKRESRFSDYYHITLLVMHTNGEYQILQGQVLWDQGGNPRVELCRAKPGAAMMESVPEEE